MNSLIGLVTLTILAMIEYARQIVCVSACLFVSLILATASVA